MTEMKVTLPVELKSQMDEFPEIDWSSIAREAFKKMLQDLRLFQEFSSESELTEEDALNLGRKVSESLAARYRE